MKQRFTASVNHPRFDAFLTQQFPEITRARAQKLIREGQARIAGKIVKPSTSIHEGMLIEIEIPETKATSLRAEAIPLDILYEDDDLIVLNKAPGLVVHPAHGNWQGTLVNALLHHCQGKLGKSTFSIGGEARPGIVHRIDKNTSGILVVAKTDVSHLSLSQQFKEHSISRKYQGICWGQIPASGEFSESITRDAKHRKRMTTSTKGKTAKTKFRRLKNFGIASLFEAELFTGRTHQIRVHFSHAGFPLLGDSTYGNSTRSARRAREICLNQIRKKDPELIAIIDALTQNSTRQMLHAYHLGIRHPQSGEFKEFNSPLPEDMQKLLDSLADSMKKHSFT